MPKGDKVYGNMARYYRRRKAKDDIWDMLAGLTAFAVLGLLVEIYLHKDDILRWSIYGGVILVIILIAMLLLMRFKRTLKEKRVVGIVNRVKDAGLEEYLKNFISRFGLGQEKSKNVWQYRNYKIDWNRINDLRQFLASKDIKFSVSNISVLLSHYIEEREYGVTSQSISVTTKELKELSGSDFEKLLYRLYVAKGYAVELTGKAGDQGGDLVATKDQERLLIQAKCYRNVSVGNGAVQQAVAAQSFYGCNKTTVITTSEFTREAVELAKANGVELISRKLLQPMLLDSLKESWG